MKEFLVTIGMEVHCELATKSKMFCACQNSMGEEIRPNENICPVCTGQPGSLPVPNGKAIEFVVRAGLALNCQIARESKFDRKNYFYPDLPKGYQISQYDQPICRNGFMLLEMKSRDGLLEQKRIGIHRIHLEEDTGKLIHKKGAGETLVDFNRAGAPLMELVTEPDIKSSAEAKKFCEELQLLFRYLGISPADMEKEQMRCEANISLYLKGENPLSGTKVELKNLNSFKAVERGIEYEIKRQKELLEKGEKIAQETRGWDENKGKTFSQRSKEEAHDYRYFPEPDILPFGFSDQYVETLREKLPELPGEKRNRLYQQFGLPPESAELLTRSVFLANYFEEVCSELEGWMEAEGHEFSEENRKKLYRLASNYLLTELSRLVADGEESRETIKITPENFAELIKIVYEGQINSSAAQTVLKEMFHSGGDPSAIIEEKNLAQTSDEGELEKVIEKIMTENPGPVADYRSGKENAMKFLMGKVMAETKGKANPQVVMKILLEKMK